MHIHTRLTTAALMGFVLIAASACGGGGGGLSTMEEESLQEQVEAAEEAQREAEARAAEEERKRKEAEAAAAEEERKRKAAEAEAERERQRAETAAEAEREKREAAEEARQQAEQQQEQLQEQLTEAEQAELRARASSFSTHLDGPTAGAVTVTWPRGGSLTFRPAGTLTPGSAAPSVPGGWRSASFTGQTGTVADGLINETVYLYTNIQAPGTRAFWKEHGRSVTMSDTLEPLARGSSAAPTSADTDPDTPGRQYTGLTVSGSLNGASGKFTCSTCEGLVGDASTGIASHVTFAQGVPDFGAVGSWTFTPSNIANGYRVDPDDAYLYFGIWSSIPDSISAPTTAYDFEYITGGSGGLTGDRFATLTGSATFRGGAVGRYVTQGQVGGQNAKIGTFTATATLNADFGDGIDAGTLSGSITDFHEDGSSLAGWRVTLGLAGNVGAVAPITGVAVTTQEAGTVANIGGLSVGGSWGATFHGSNNADLADTTMYPATRYPPADLAGVTGWFDATGTNASLAGAFGAVCTTGTMCAR